MTELIHDVSAKLRQPSLRARNTRSILCSALIASAIAASTFGTRTTGMNGIICSSSTKM